MLHFRSRCATVEGTMAADSQAQSPASPQFRCVLAPFVLAEGANNPMRWNPAVLVSADGTRTVESVGVIFDTCLTFTIRAFPPLLKSKDIDPRWIWHGLCLYVDERKHHRE